MRVLVYSIGKTFWSGISNLGFESYSQRQEEVLVSIHARVLIYKWNNCISVTWVIVKFTKIPPMSFCCCKYQICHLQPPGSRISNLGRMIKVDYKIKFWQKLTMCFYSEKEKHTTNAKSNHMVRSAPPLATNKPAYITFIICRQKLRP